jgi:hypothetical protein
MPFEQERAYHLPVHQVLLVPFHHHLAEHHLLLVLHPSDPSLVPWLPGPADPDPAVLELVLDRVHQVPWASSRPFLACRQSSIDPAGQRS